MPALRFASHRQVAEQAALRPPRYLLDLERIIVRRDEHGIWYDAARPAYLELVRKYRPVPRPSPPHPLAPSPRQDIWQAWRAEGGRWVADGWLRPGFYADPPCFDPLPGEVLQCPAFPAADFRAPPGDGPIDVVIPLSAGSKHGDAELRYCLRSIAKHFEGLGRVWIVGHRPTWLRGIQHIPAGDSHISKDVNIIRKIEAACRAGVSRQFVRISDDQILLRPLAFSQLGPYTWGDLRGRPIGNPQEESRRWYRRLRRTSGWLAERGLPTFQCDTHVPIPMDRDRFLELADRTRDAWELRDGMCVNTWYCNQAGRKPQPMQNRKATIEAALPAEEIRRRVAGRWFLGYNDAGFTPDLRALLDELFPEKCRFEEEEENTNPHSSALISWDQRSSSLSVRPAGPTLSIIIPTIGRPALTRTLESIRGQDMVDGDEVLVVQDGPSDLATWAVVKASGLPGRYLATGKRANDVGAAPRNFGIAHADGEYLAFMDDDDVYRPGAFDAIRAAAVRHPRRPLMFRMERPGWARTIWQDQAVRYGNVSTQLFVTPNHPGRLGTWGPYHTGDLAFILSTLRCWPPGSLLWEPATIAEVPQTQSTLPVNHPMLRNLIYHVYPVATNDEWKLNVERLCRSWTLFNGRKIVGVVCDNDTVPVEAVQAAFPDDAIEWLVAPNDPVRGETVTFLPAAKRLESLNSYEATFYAHAKGTHRAGNPKNETPAERIRQWRDFCYRGCLERLPPDFDDIIHVKPCAGCLKRQKGLPQEKGRPESYWHYSGNFWWINHAHFFSLPDALHLGPSRWALERHLGELFPEADAVCLAGDDFRGWPYRMTEGEWSAMERQAFGSAQLQETTHGS